MSDPTHITLNYPIEVHDEDKLMEWCEKLLDDDEAFAELRSKPTKDRLQAAAMLCLSTAFSHFIESEEPDWGIA